MTRVIKLGGRAQADSAPFITAAWAAAPGSFCLVHGGGDEVSAFQKKSGVEPQFVGGRRVTSEADIAVLRMVLSGLVNKRLVSELVSAGVPAVGLSGEDAALITATLAHAGKLGRVGTPISINRRVLDALLGAELLPVISPLARDEAGHDGLNVNGDDAAASIAVALGADELLLVADVGGVHDGAGGLLHSLDPESARSLIVLGAASGGMAAKLEAALVALAGGVRRVRVCSLAGLTDQQCGTHITLTLSLV